MIEVQNISKVYGKKANAFKALDSVSFKIPIGASVAIVGKSGSGKSTLMHIMSGLDRPTSGDIIIGGKKMSDLSQKAIDRFRSNRIGFIFQSFFVQGNESCYNNVSLPLEIARTTRRNRRKMIEDALHAVQLDEKIKSRARDLSGGQKQRLAVARAIVNKPNLLFADEPTGNLDSSTGKVIEDLLFKYNRENKVTLIIVTHDDDLSKRCDIQINLKDGKIQSIKGKK